MYLECLGYLEGQGYLESMVTSTSTCPYRTRTRQRSCKESRSGMRCVSPTKLGREGERRVERKGKSRNTRQLNACYWSKYLAISSFVTFTIGYGQAGRYRSGPHLRISITL